MSLQTIHLSGRDYVVVEKEQYERLATLARAADLPPLPKPDSAGNVPAVEYARASLARKIIKDRVAAGMTQRELARQAGIRFETLCRIEKGRHTPSVPTIDSIDRILKRVLSQRSKVKKA